MDSSACIEKSFVIEGAFSDDPRPRVMKISIAICSGAALLLFASLNTRASVIAGPIINPANGHEYYLHSPNNWTASEAEAEQLGGTLANIRNASEQEWVFSTFGAYGG